MAENYNPLISVIIPVWNPGPGISRCIESLRNQTVKEIEMIFVDDCGTDDSMEKVRAASEEDSRVRIIENEENIGAGQSRNMGIEAAHGEYLSFVDPDDYIAPDFLELLYKKAESKRYDIVKGSVVQINEKGQEIITGRSLNHSIRKGLAEGRQLYTLFSYEHHSAIYRSEFLILNNIRYGNSLRAQDTTFLLRACSKVNTFEIVDAARYYFCERTGSAMHTIDADHLTGYLDYIRETIEYAVKEIPQEKRSTAYFCGRFMDALREYKRYENNVKMENAPENYLEGLRSELLTIPFCDDLTRASYPMRALADYCLAMPTIPYYSPWEGANPPVRYAELSRDWITFYLDHPRERNSCQLDLVRVCCRAMLAVHGKPSTTYSSDECRIGTAILREQLKRCPMHLRFIISARYVTGSRLMSIPGPVVHRHDDKQS